MNKQIEEMRDDISCIEKECRQFCRGRRCRECRLFFSKMDCKNQFMAEGLFAKGYRKKADVASEIISEIEQAIMAHGTNYALKRLEEIKKKYIGEQE